MHDWKMPDQNSLKWNMQDRKMRDWKLQDLENELTDHIQMDGPVRKNALEIAGRM